VAHTREWKERNLQAITSAINASRVVGVASIRGLPAAQLQEIRKKLYGSAGIYVSRAKLLRMAVNSAGANKKGIEKLESMLKNDQIALVTSDMDPFKLYRVIESSKKPMPAKGGEIAPEDIEIKAGETQFKPGPIVGELQKAGIPAGIEGGKVVIKKDKLLVKKGEVITPQIAAALSRMEIYPLVAGLDIKAIFEGGLIFGKETLQVDEKKMLGDMALASAQALSLAVRTRYFVPESVRALISEARRWAVNLSVNASYPTPDTAEMLLRKAAAQAAALEGAAEKGG
jgi:large subunit ribosomal protein L10